MRWLVGAVIAIGLASSGGPAFAQRTVEGTPTDLLPPSMTEAEQPASQPKAKKAKAKRVEASDPLPAIAPTVAPAVPTLPAVLPPVAELPPPVAPVPLPSWSIVNARALLANIETAGSRGLMPADYGPEALKLAIAGGEGDALNAVATDAFTKLGLDLRDGRTPRSARIQWLVKDTDAANMPIDGVLRQALESGGIDASLASLEPRHPDYTILKAMLAKTAPTDKARVQLIRTNMDRWRWMPQSLGPRFMYANVPEYMLRVFANQKNIAIYPIIVGKTDTQTPSLDAMAQGVVIHPPWNLPRSIINESVGALIAKNPAAARARGYVWTGSGKTLAVTQKSGPNSALGVIKVDMPNAESIFIHDTPSRHLFGGPNKALSHGCLRTDRAMELGILLGIIQGGFEAEELADLIKAGKTTKVPFKANIPVYISYFTLGTAVDGTMKVYTDLYGRDAAVAASFAKPRSALIPAPIAVPAGVVGGAK
jgi:L,D-transpeptidase YcbB